MSLAWPWALAALLVVPLIPALGWWLRRRRRQAALTVSSVALICAALPGRRSWRRRIPAFLFLLGLVPLALALTRPEARVPVAADNTSILLAIDVSGSMCSTDVKPNRLAAASDAARRFIQAQDDGTRIGLVAFSGIAGELVPPTTDKDDLLNAIDTFRTAFGTAIGQAILVSIDAIAEQNPAVAGTGTELPAPPAGEYQPDTIVVLTDGSNTTGVDPVTAAEQAAARGVRVFTIGFGSTDPGPMVCTPDQIGGGDGFGGRPNGFGQRPQGGSGGGGFRRLVDLDEDTLTQVADLTGGQYFRAPDAENLDRVLADLPQNIGVRNEDVEITVWFVLAGVLLVFAGVGLSWWWQFSAVSLSPAAQRQ